MFTSALQNKNNANAVEPILDVASPLYRMSDYGYGKKFIRVFQLKKDKPIHEVIEYKVSVQARLRTHKEYLQGDNSDVVGSDVQETNVYLHAQQFGLRTPEEFALSLSEHFLNSYDLIMHSNVIVENISWEPLGVLEKSGTYKGKSHNHTFTRDTNGKRYCEVLRKRNETPLLIGGLSDLRVVKTAKAPFTGYVKDSNLFTEGDQPDRILAIEIDARWQYDGTKVKDIDFNSSWSKVRDLILQSFAGDTVEGTSIPSVQFGSYKAERLVLDTMPEINSISIKFLNFPHLPYDFARFKNLSPRAAVVICNPKEEPLSIGYAQTDRL